MSSAAASTAQGIVATLQPPREAKAGQWASTAPWGGQADPWHHKESSRSPSVRFLYLIAQDIIVNFLTSKFIIHPVRLKELPRYILQNIVSNLTQVTCHIWIYETISVEAKHFISGLHVGRKSLLIERRETVKSCMSINLPVKSSVKCECWCPVTWSFHLLRHQGYKLS